MNRIISAKIGVGGPETEVTIDARPDRCAVCHSHITPIFIRAMTWGGNTDNLQVAYQCPNLSCESLFIAMYAKSADKFRFESLRPRTPRPEKFSEFITGCSPNFEKIYNEALAAEAYELMEIAGIGYRKSLEFLIKDFAKSKNPEDHAEIEELQLMAVIKKYVDDDKVKRAAERAVWLGNDETHYIRRWNKDLNDLKTLLRIAVHAIENIIELDSFMVEMPKGRKAELKKKAG